MVTMERMQMGMREFMEEGDLQGMIWILEFAIALNLVVSN